MSRTQQMTVSPATLASALGWLVCSRDSCCDDVAVDLIRCTNLRRRLADLGASRQATAQLRRSSLKDAIVFPDSSRLNSTTHAVIPMAALPYGAIVNIVTLVVFFVYLNLSFYLCARQGLGRSAPWIWLMLLSICRLTQVAIDLYATMKYAPKTTPNTELESGVAILTSMGLTPLFMATSSLLNTTTRPKGRRMQWILLILHIPLIISFILIVAGGIDPDSRDGPTFAATEATKTGITLYVVCFVVLIWATTVISARLYLAEPDEVKILTTVVISLPFFVVDVVYMMCFAYEAWGPEDYDAWEHMRFNVISGNVTIQLCMQVVMEYVITGLYLGLGLELPSKAARLREQVEDRIDQARGLDVDQLQETVLWKLHNGVSKVVAAMIMPALQFAHWMLGKILRS